MVQRKGLPDMKIPKQLKIGGHVYKVLLKDLDKSVCGDSDRVKNLIRIDSNFPQNQREVTLIHEILHCINNEFNHALLDSLAEQLYQVLKDNNLLK